jgi:hypothetical protein
MVKTDPIGLGTLSGRSAQESWKKVAVSKCRGRRGGYLYFVYTSVQVEGEMSINECLLAEVLFRGLSALSPGSGICPRIGKG